MPERFTTPRNPKSGQVTIQKAPPLTPTRPRIIQDELREQAQTAFLGAYEQIGTITHAGDEVGISRRSHYDWLENDPEYAERWEAAQRAGDEALLREARRRGVEGVPQGVYYQGEKVDTEIKYSDNLLMFMIKGRMPQYRDRFEVTGANGGPIQVQAMRQDAISRLSEAQLDALAALNGLPTAGLLGPRPGVPADIEGEVVAEAQEVGDQAESESPEK